MSFYKKTFKKINNKWYPQSTLVGSPVTTVKAIAIKDGVSSEVASKTFTQSTGGESD